MSKAKWPRPQWSDGGERAFLLWFVFGDFPAEFRIDAAKYRTRGMPDGVQVIRYVNRELAKWDGYPLAGALGAMLWEEDAALFERAKRARECIVIRGEIADPADLDPLRDVVGTIAGLCDLGAVAVIDPQTLDMADATGWRARFFDDDAFHPRDHVLILCSDDEHDAGRAWVHTRGMRKFARPDVSIVNVPPEAVDAAGELALRFVAFQCAGGIVEEGREVEVDGLPEGMRARHGGEAADPDFNNTHFELRWPG